jgi:hypothetical protein
MLTWHSLLRSAVSVVVMMGHYSQVRFEFQCVLSIVGYVLLYWSSEHWTPVMHRHPHSMSIAIACLGFELISFVLLFTAWPATMAMGWNVYSVVRAFLLAPESVYSCFALYFYALYALTGGFNL